MKVKVLITIFSILIINELNAATIWNKKEHFPATARHRTSGFSIGNIGYMGLGHYNSGPEGNVLLADFWAYDPSTDSWTQVADFGGGQRYHCIDWVYENKAYVGTGRTPSANLETDIWCFDPIANTWTFETDLPSFRRRGAVSFVIGDYGYIGCGQLQGASSWYGNDFYAYHFPTGVWYALPDLPGPQRTSSCAFVIDDKAYVGTGNTTSGAGLDFYEYKPSTNSWTPKANVGTIPRVEAYGFSLMGKGYIMCGASWSSGFNYSDMYEYDATTDTWTQLPDFPGLGRRYLDGFEINNKAYMTCGTNGTNLKDMWEFNPTNALTAGNFADFNIQTYPNPAIDMVRFDFGNSGVENSWGAEIQLYSMSGSIVLRHEILNSIEEVNLSNLETGTYIYSILGDGNNLTSGKIQIAR